MMTPNADTSKHSSVGSPHNQKDDMKTSLEKQRVENKKKFQEPFFIQIDGAHNNKGEANNMKIVKMVKSENQSDNDSVSDSDDSQASGNLVNSKSLYKKNQATVEEVTEEDEQSPRSVHKHKPIRNKSKNKKKNKQQSNSKTNGDKFEKVSVDSVKTIPNLVKLDLNLDILKNYLEDIQVAVNDHASAISTLQTDITKKAYEKTIGFYLQKISESLQRECGERPHAFRLDDQYSLKENYQTEDSLVLKKYAEKMIDKFEIIGLNIINLNKFKGDSGERLDQLERQVAKCFTIDMFREESQQQEYRVTKYINDQLGNFQENLNQYKKELSEALTFFEKKVNDNQSESLWRIKDCEELLKSRVSDKYINDSIKALDEKIVKQMQYTDEKQIERLEKSFKELGQRIVQTNIFVNDKFDDARKMLKQYDDKLINVATVDKVAAVSSGYKDMKYNFERELELMQEHVKDVKDRMGELSKKLNNFEVQQYSTDFTGGVLNAQQTTGTQQKQQQVNQPEHSRNQSQQLFSQSNKNTSGNDKQSPNPKGETFNSNVQQVMMSNPQPSSPSLSPLMRRKALINGQVSSDIEKKVVQFEESINYIQNQLEFFSKVLEDKVGKDDVKRLTSDKVTKEDLVSLLPNEELTLEKTRYIVREEMDQLQRQIMEQMKSLDQRMVRLRQDTDLHHLQKIIDKKANEEQVRNDFGNHEFKISTLDRNLIKMAQDFETFQQAINKLHFGLFELQEMNRDVLVGKRTISCLSCGKGGDNQQSLKGRDGRLYKGGEQQFNSAKGGSNIEDIQDNHLLYTGAHSSQVHLMQQNMTMSQHYGQTDTPPSGLLNNDINMSQIDFKNNRNNSSLYDIGTGGENAYDFSYNLPQLHKKLNGVGFGIKANAGLQSNASGIIGSASILPSGQASRTSVTTSVQHSAKRKLPFGFQVQNEKKELLKIEGKKTNRTTKSLLRPNERPDSAKALSHFKSNFLAE